MNTLQQRCFIMELSELGNDYRVRETSCSEKQPYVCIRSASECFTLDLSFQVELIFLFTSRFPCNCKTFSTFIQTRSLTIDFIKLQGLGGHSFLTYLIKLKGKAY